MTRKTFCEGLVGDNQVDGGRGGGGGALWTWMLWQGCLKRFYNQKNTCTLGDACICVCVCVVPRYLAIPASKWQYPKWQYPPPSPPSQSHCTTNLAIRQNVFKKKTGLAAKVSTSLMLFQNQLRLLLLLLLAGQLCCSPPGRLSCSQIDLVINQHWLVAVEDKTCRRAFDYGEYFIIVFVYTGWLRDFICV